MTNKEKQNLARSLFVKSSLTRKQIAIQVVCTEKTLRSWIIKFEWEKERETQTITRVSLLKDAYAQLGAINKDIFENHNGVPNKALSDAKATIRKEIEFLSSNPLHIYIEVFTEFTDWVATEHGSEMLEMLGLTDEFINHLATKKGV
jgi:hypothetical protein